MLRALLPVFELNIDADELRLRVRVIDQHRDTIRADRGGTQLLLGVIRVVAGYSIVRRGRSAQGELQCGVRLGRLCRFGCGNQALLGLGQGEYDRWHVILR